MKLPFRELGRRIEGDQILQYKIHKIMSRVWIVVTLPLLALAILEPHVWVVVGVAYVMVASNYAYWATDNGAMAAANASTPDNITPFAIEHAEEARP
jgi:amino acid permease